MKKLFAIPLMLLAIGTGFAAEGDSAKAEAAAPSGPNLEEAIANVKGQVEGLNESYLETKATVDKLAKIKFSGYVQAQWQYADSNGIQNVAGGAFAANSQERFQVRRGRIKAVYEGLTSRYALQIDVIPSGVSIKDAYATWMEPWLKTFSGTAGVFDRPFGFEISYSSSSREAPERTRMYQTLFPGERDMGVKLEIAPPADMGLLGYFNFKGGLFTGMGPTANEIDNAKDMIGRLGFAAPFYDLNLAIDGGFSAYLGSVTNVNDTVLSVGTKAGDTLAFLPSTGNKLKEIDRNIFGVDAQVYYDLPVIGGFSLRGEYLWGDQPGTTGSSLFYSGTPAATPATPAPLAPRLATREFMGWYLAWIQNLGPKFQTVVRYDVYDPNTQVEGKDVFRNSSVNATDLMYTTIGLGGVFHWDENTKFTLYYDMVENETANAPATAAAGSKAWNSDLADNVITFRMQTKF